MSTAVEIANREAERLRRELIDALNEGFEPYHWWDPPVEQGDRVKIFGMIALVKRAIPAPRSL